VSRLEIILAVFLTFSIIFNVGLFLYTRAALIRLLSVSEELGDLQEMVNSFARHLKDVYEMDMFYGEPILMELVDKTRLIREEIERFEEIYVLTTDIEAIEEDFENDTTTEEEEEAQ